MAFDITQDGATQVVRFTDEVELEDFSRLTGELLQASRVLFDLRNVVAPQDDALREAATELARQLAQRRCRTAYLADRPVVRGWASMVAYRGGDEFARTVATDVAAQRWLEANIDSTQARKGAVELAQRLQRRLRLFR